MAAPALALAKALSVPPFASTSARAIPLLILYTLLQRVFVIMRILWGKGAGLQHIIGYLVTNLTQVVDIIF